MPTALIQISSEKEKKHENVRFGGESVWESTGEGEESTQQVADYGLKVICLGVRLTIVTELE